MKERICKEFYRPPPWFRARDKPLVGGAGFQPCVLPVEPIGRPAMARAVVRPVLLCRELAGRLVVVIPPVC